MRHIPKIQKEKYCGYCKKEYIPFEGVNTKYWILSRFCSKSCSAFSRREIYREICKKVGKLPTTPEERVKLSKSLIGQKRNLGTKYSEETKIKMSLARRGRKMKEFDKYVTPENKRERGRFRSQIQKVVFERDNYTCQLCGVRGKSMTVDHIQPWAEYVELRFCIDNCRTLCVKCHYKITFGKPMPPTVRTWGLNMKQLQGGTNL